jgi:hypothetical protein
MVGSYVVVRLPSRGTLLGEAVARHPGSVVTCVTAGMHDHDGRPFVDHLALVEGLPDAAIASVLLAWSHQHGEPAQVLGGPFALRLPVALDAPHTETVATCLRLAYELPDVTQRLCGDVLELWGACRTPDEAQRKRDQIRRAFAGPGVLSVEVAHASRQDLECWALLRTAAVSVVPDCLVAA